MSKAIYYPMSISDSEASDDEDSDEALLDFDSVAFPSLKKPKNKTKKTQPPLTLSPSPTKSKPPRQRKSNEEKQRIQLEKQKAKEEKANLKRIAAEEKEREKAEKKKKCELLKQIKPGECIKYIKAFIDSSLLSGMKFGGELLTALQKAEIDFEVREQRVPGTISWERKTSNTQDINVPNHTLVVWTWKELITLISLDNLNSTVKELLRQHPSYKLTIVIFGIEEYFRQRKIRENRQLKAQLNEVHPSQTKTKDLAPELSTNLSRNDVEMALAYVQVMLNVQYRFFETNEEIGLFVAQFTKAVAELPHKLQKYKNQESMEWYAEADSRECVRVDNDGNGLARLWPQQLCQFPSIGNDVAQAVAAEYPAPSVLMDAYNRCSRQEGEKLLQHIQVRRTQGLLSSSRQVGPVFSRKAYKFFTSTDGNVMLNDE